MPFFFDQSHYAEIAQGLREYDIEASAMHLRDGGEVTVPVVVIDQAVALVNQRGLGGWGDLSTLKRWSLYRVIHGTIDEHIETLDVRHDAMAAEVVTAVAIRFNHVDPEDVIEESVNEVREIVQMLIGALERHHYLEVKTSGGRQGEQVASAAVTDRPLRRSAELDALATMFQNRVRDMDISGNESEQMMELLRQIVVFLIHAHSRIERLEGG